MTSSNKVKGFAAGVVAAVCYGTNPLGTLELYGDGFNSSSVLIFAAAVVPEVEFEQFYAAFVSAPEYGFAFFVVVA